MPSSAFAISRPVRPDAERTWLYCLNVCCTFHWAQSESAMPGMSRNIVQSKNGNIMWASAALRSLPAGLWMRLP